MIRVQTEDFDIGEEIDRLSAGRPEVGAVVSFTGLVRARESVGDEPVTAITLDHYPAMSRAKLEEIEAEARRRWALADCLVIHRYGRLLPGERIVLVVTLAPHRADAFAAASFLMDWLKTRAPFWKLEETATGKRWVGAAATDDAAARRWGTTAED